MFISEFNITIVDADSKIAALFDGNNTTCGNIQDILTIRSYLKVSKLNNISGSLTFDIQFLGLRSCLDYELIYIVFNGDSCNYVKSCNVTHDLAARNRCIVSCSHCYDTCDVVVSLYSLTNNINGSVCEVSSI